MILHTDIPTRAQVDRLLAARHPCSVSIYVPTDPASSGEAARIELKNLGSEALDQLRQAGAGRAQIAAIEDELSDLVEDESFLRHQARSVAVFVTPESMITFRLPHRLVSWVEASDRFHVKPLLRALTFPQLAYVLALAQGSVRLIEIAPDVRPDVVRIPDLPSDVADAVGKASITDRAPTRRIQGSEGQKIRIRQYARQVDEALRPFLNGVDVPLILAASEPTATIFRSVNSYPHLASETIPGNWEAQSDGELAQRAREVMDRLYSDELREVRELYASRASEQRTATDVAEVARAATYAAVDTLLVDIETTVTGSISPTGAVTFGEPGADTYGVVDEIARRVWLAGGRVLAVRREDIPGSEPVAAILRYPFR